MAYRVVFRQLATLLLVLSIILATTAVVFYVVQAWLDHDVDVAAELALILTSVAGFLVALLMRWYTPKTTSMLGRREALLLVAMSWLVGAAFCAMPYFLWSVISQQIPPDHVFHNPIDCYFESMSGLTTTGATVLSDIEAMPKSLLLWRATTHWLGGLGIVVLFVAVLPSLGIGGKRLVSVESTGPMYEGVRPGIRETARVLWLIYLGLTLVLIGLLCVAGMDFFESVCHAFATIATGGFSTRNASVAAFDSRAIEIILIVFMILSGVNFGLYYQMMHGRIRRVWRDPELRAYLLVIAIASAVVAMCLMQQPIHTTSGDVSPPDVGGAILHGTFQVTSIQSTTGFATADFNLWSFLPQAILITLMFIGGSAGSTSGGIKVIRIWLALKIIADQIERTFRPHVVRPIRLGAGQIDPALKLAVLSYILGIILLSMLGAVGIMLLEPGLDFTTASTASIATLNTIGPGLARVGAIENFGWFSAGSKLLMCLLMALGRLELFALVVLVSPRFWRGD